MSTKGNTYIVGSGGGGKGGGGSVRTPVEAPNTLKSKSYIKIVEVLCEGEIEGLANGLQSVFFDKTPLQNSDGTFNFSDVVVEERTGTLDQTITSIGGETASTVSVGTEIKQANPVEYTITNADVDKARVAIRIPALTNQNTENGDLNGTSVSLKVEYQPNGGSWIQPPVGSTTFTVNPNSFTDVDSVAGSVLVTSPFTSKKICTGKSGNNCRIVKTFISCTATIQYQKDLGVWTTISVTTVKGENIPVNFSLDTVRTSTYALRVVLSAGQSVFSFTNGTKVSGEITISGKTTSPYERDVEFRLTGSAPWIIRVTRLTADSNSSALQNKTYLSSVTSIFEEKFRYPSTAYMAISVDAEQFGSIPERAYEVKLLKIKIPTNYNPVERTYAGIWDGTFKVEWSDNPAWCFYDLLTNTLYGLGERIDAGQIDKWQLYDIAQYCDELVDAGNGELEPRFTCNLLIQTREEAYKVLQDMASIFAGMTYWGSSEGFQGVIPVADKPQTTYSYIYNNSNVVDGVFQYQTANVNTQFNAAYVTYNDPNNNYEQAVVYVPDNDSIASDGYVNETNVVAFGCTSRAQATRLGRRVLYTNRYENEVVSFSVGADGVIPSVGSLVQVSDSLRAGERRGGRVKEYVDSTHLKLDTAFTFINGVTYNICVIGFDGKFYESQIVNPLTTTDTVELVTALTNTIAKNSAFIISDSGLQTELFKIISVSETENHVYSVSAVKHDPSKYGYIDNLVELVDRDTSNIALREPITNLSYSEVLYQDNLNVKSKLVLSWTPARYSSSYIVSYSYAGNNIVTNTVTSPSFEILDTINTVYSISVVSVDVLSGKSAPVTIDIEVTGKLAAPDDVTNLTVNAFANAANISWDLHPDLDVRVGGFIEIRHTSKTVGYKWEDGAIIATVSGSNTSAVGVLLSGTYMAKAIDSSGVYSLGAAFADSNFALIQQFNLVTSVTEQTAWAGSKINTVKYGDYLTLLPTGTVDDVTKLWDELYNIDTLDFAIYSNGEYEFFNKIDLGEVATSRVTSSLKYLAFDIANTIDERIDPIDEWVLFDGGSINDSFVDLYIATTNDDPNNITAVWSGWKKFIIADYKARGFKFKLILTNRVTTSNIQVEEASVTVDMPDRVVGEDDITAPNTGYTVVYSNPFYIKPSVAIRIDNMQQGDYYEITDNTASGFTILFRNASGTAVSRQFDYIAKGWGYVFV